MISMAIYHDEKGNIDDMLKYYQMAIGKGSTLAMNNLGYFYQQRKDYVNMEKYYLMAIKKKDFTALVNLRDHYESQGDYKNMFKYSFSHFLYIFILIIDFSANSCTGSGCYRRIISRGWFDSTTWETYF